MIQLKEIAHINRFHKFDCAKCGTPNTVTDYAVKNIRKGNIHITSCAKCETSFRVVED